MNTHHEIELHIRGIAAQQFPAAEVENFLQKFRELCGESPIEEYFLQISTDEGEELELGFFNDDCIADITLSRGTVYSCKYPVSAVRGLEILDLDTKWTLKISGDKKLDYNVVKSCSLNDLENYELRLRERLNLWDNSPGI